MQSLIINEIYNICHMECVSECNTPLLMPASRYEKHPWAPQRTARHTWLISAGDQHYSSGPPWPARSRPYAA